MNERPTPRTDSAIMEIPSKFGSICVVRVELALDLERELGEALDDLQVLRSNKMSDPLLETTFKNIIRERDEALEENKKFREALEWIAERYDDFKPLHSVAMDAYEMSCIARAALRMEEAK